MKTAKVEVIPETGTQPATPGFRIFNRIVDWITNDRLQLINITERINEIVQKSGIRDGIVHLQSLHTTTAVFINEWQDALLHDVRTFLEDIVCREQGWRHNPGPESLSSSAKFVSAAGHMAEHHSRGVRRTAQPFHVGASLGHLNAPPLQSAGSRESAAAGENLDSGGG